MQQAITLLIAHSEEDFVSKAEAKNAGANLHLVLTQTADWNLVGDVLKEVNRAESKHPNWPEDKIYAMAIVGEEYGEATREAVKIEMNEDDANIDNLEKELIHTAATAIRALKHLRN